MSLGLVSETLKKYIDGLHCLVGIEIAKCMVSALDHFHLHSSAIDERGYLLVDSPDHFALPPTSTSVGLRSFGIKVGVSRPGDCS